MDRLLVTRTDSLVGANAALTLADRLEVIGAGGAATNLFDERTTDRTPFDAASACETIRELRPRLVIHSGPCAVAGWDVGGLGAPNLPARGARQQESDVALAMAAACRDAGAKLVVVVTDGMFAGPHMFHTENARPNAAGPFARGAAAVERALRSTDALIVRSHVYGWSPAAYGANYAERMFHELTGEMPCPVDAVRHATPILATDLAECLYEAFRRRLSGLFNVTGAERTSPYRFAAELAVALGVPGRFVQLTAKPERGQRVNVEETSLNTLAFRRATGRPLPMLRDGLARFAAQAFNGYRGKIGSQPPQHVLEAQAA